MCRHGGPVILLLTRKQYSSLSFRGIEYYGDLNAIPQRYLFTHVHKLYYIYERKGYGI